jgi:hypothetical protein
MDEIYTVREVANFLSCSIEEVKRLAQDGRLSRDSRHPGYFADDINQVLEELDEAGELDRVPRGPGRWTRVIEGWVVKRPRRPRAKKDLLKQ